jgi:hypothetical protein
MGGDGRRNEMVPVHGMKQDYKMVINVRCRGCTRAAERCSCPRKMQGLACDFTTRASVDDSGKTAARGGGDDVLLLMEQT